MKVTLIPVNDIEAENRARPVSLPDLEWMMADLQDRGLRSPIEVAKHPSGKGYQLVAGAHRLQAHKELGWEKIECVIVKGTQAELRRHELLENLARRELSALEEAQFLAELKRVEMELTGARNGGDRKSEGFQKSVGQDGQLISWYEVAGQASGKSARTIRRAATLGEQLCPDAAAILRDTRFEDNQKELLALARQPLEAQSKIAQMIYTRSHSTSEFLLTVAKLWILLPS